MFRFALALAPLAASQSDGNPHEWDRMRRCDHIDYDPPCGACEGIGGYVHSDEKDDIQITSCELVAINPVETRIRPVWGKDISEFKSHEILIGVKNDPACFQSFPHNDSTATNCYKPQEVQVFSDMNKYKALVMVANQGGNAWGVVGNVSSTIFHQNEHMWIVNILAGLVNQCICTEPREGGDKTTPAVYPLQSDWNDNLIYLSTEKIGVEYGVGEMELDHWAFGPHHAWTDPATGLIVRMWQPFNGLQIFEPGSWKTGSAYEDAMDKGGIFTKSKHLFDQLAVDGSQAPKKCTKKAPLNTFRIKCDDNGFPSDYDPPTMPTHLDHMLNPAGDNSASSSDLKRARTKVPRDDFKGDDFGSMSQTLNKYLQKHAPNSKECDLWTMEELQQLQISLLMLRDTQLNDLYHETDDNRKIKMDIQQLAQEWEELNKLAATDPDLARAHRDGHCHEAVMWYVHHLTEDMKDVLKDQVALPLLSGMRHDLKETALHGERVHQAYQEKVTCGSCHSAPAAITV
jgi:hypothetical protein